MKNLIFILLLAATCQAQVNTTCTLYGNTATCTSHDNGAEIRRQQQAQYEAGNAAGSAVGMAIFRAHFPGWRKKYCSQHPSQPFYYGNARGDSITGTCPSLDGLSNEAAQEFVGKHPGAVKSQAHAALIDRYIADNSLPPWESKSYEKAAKETESRATETPKIQSVSAQPVAGDVFWWFDEQPPAPSATLFPVLITPRAYDGALTLLRQARGSNTDVKAGQSVLDTNFHPSSVSLEAWRKANNSSPPLFYWNGEHVDKDVSVMHFNMTQRAYEQTLSMTAGSDLRFSKPE
jgi:hypothetical protein